MEKEMSLHPWDGYLTGPENELAMAAAKAMAQGEHAGISPLIVYGPSGVGKSRLLAGLVSERLRRQPSSAVACLDAQAFVTACLEAATMAGGVGWPALRGRFRSVDLFVLEDLEGLERGPLAWNELTHVLDALEATGAAMAFSAKSAPGTWSSQACPRRLVNRLLGGLITQITPPSLTSRRRYILQHASQYGVLLQTEAVERLAEAADGYRTLEGWISRLALEARLADQPQGMEMANSNPSRRPRSSVRQHTLCSPLDSSTITTILAEDTLLAEPQVTIDTIARAVASEFAIQLRMLRGPGRRSSIVVARQVAMYLIRMRTNSSFNAIGIYFGGRDPATVRHACKTIAVRLSADPVLATAVARLEAPWIRTKS
jgi:chromosomal replication initiator protein